VKDGSRGEEWLVNLAFDFDFHMGQTALLPLRRKACCGFSHPKNPTASAGFKPAILGTRGQHANYKTTEAAMLKTKFHTQTKQQGKIMFVYNLIFKFLDSKL
jgi:hypothetical protein